MRRIASLVGITIVLALAGFGVVQIVRVFVQVVSAESTTALDSVWVGVEVGRLEIVESFSASGIAPPTGPVHSPSSGRITEVHKNPGDTLNLGDPALSISGVTLSIVDPTVFVPFRDLQQGSFGDDVIQLQAYLRQLGYYEFEPDGRFQARTAAAVKAFNADRGMGGQASFLLASALIIATPAEVDQVLVRQGSQVNTGDQVLLLKLGDLSVGAEVDDSLASVFPVGSRVRLVGSGDTIDGVVDSIGELLPTPEGRVLRSIRISTPSTSDAVVVGASYRVEIVLSESLESAVLIPTLAIKSDPTGALFVTVQTSKNGTFEGRRVDVITGLSDGRRIVVESGLEVGDLVQVPKR